MRYGISILVRIFDMILLHIKLIYNTFKDFFLQWNVRPFGNNVQMLVNGVRLIFSGYPDRLYERKHRLNRALLERIITLPNRINDATPVDKYRVWVLWWQGEENMPEIVRCTYKSICRMAGKEVVLITKDNLKDYVYVDEWIEKKVGNGVMKLPAFSDYIRFSLLYEYGGMWIDSTVLCTKKLPQSMFDSEFFSIHNDNVPTAKYVARGRWNVQVLGTNRCHLEIFGDCLHVFREYWRRYDHIMDYLLVDYTIDYVYNEKESIRCLIDAVPVTNTCMHVLLDKFDVAYSNICDEFDETWKDTWMFKLTYKHKFIEWANGDYTLYKYIVDEFK